MKLVNTAFPSLCLHHAQSAVGMLKKWLMRHLKFDSKYQFNVIKIHVFTQLARKVFGAYIAQRIGVDMGILRTIIVLSGLMAFIPGPPEDANQDVKTVGNSYADGAGYIQVATGTFSDLSNFCNRQPGVCKTAGYMAYKLERKAKYGVRLIYEWANEAAPQQSNIATQSDPITTSSTKLASVQKAVPVSQSTLQIDDLVPVWLGPSAPKNG